jgi:hypothetical protein
MTPTPKIVETPHCHVWTDALHAKALAHQARNKWDRGTYVRWCVMTACTALEVACHDATGNNSIPGGRFKEYLDRELEEKGRPPLMWGEGIWQQVQEVRKRRNGNAHQLKKSERFPDAAEADEAISVIRSAIIDIYKRVEKIVPPWTADDEGRGWDKRPRTGGNATLIHAGVDRDAADTIRICFVKDGGEHTSDVFPPGTEWQPHVDALIRNVRVPISEVRVYQGQVLLASQELHIRGN